MLDTNVWISAYLYGGKPAQVVEMGNSGKIKILISKPILDEFRRVLKKGFHLPAGEAKQYVQNIIEISELIHPDITVEEIDEDPSDNRILECALFGKADFIVSGDKKHLIPLGIYSGIRILTPAQFTKEIQE